MLEIVVSEGEDEERWSVEDSGSAEDPRPEHAWHCGNSNSQPSIFLILLPRQPSTYYKSSPSVAPWWSSVNASSSVWSAKSPSSKGFEESNMANSWRAEDGWSLNTSLTRSSDFVSCHSSHQQFQKIIDQSGYLLGTSLTLLKSLWMIVMSQTIEATINWQFAGSDSLSARMVDSHLLNSCFQVPWIIKPGWRVWTTRLLEQIFAMLASIIKFLNFMWVSADWCSFSIQAVNTLLWNADARSPIYLVTCSDSMLFYSHQELWHQVIDARRYLVTARLSTQSQVLVIFSHLADL